MVKKNKERNDERDEYIKSLENEIKLLSLKQEKIYDSDGEISVLLKKQEEFLVQQYYDKENLLSENRRLNDEISRLIRTISLNHNYINYLANSFWWKFTFPMRFIYRKLKTKGTNYQFVKDAFSEENLINVEDKVSVLIFTYNAGEEFSIQLDNLNKQKKIKDMEIIVVDRGSQDHTIDYAKKYGAKIINIDNLNITDSEVYEKILPTIDGEYVVIIDQNKIVDSKFWIYQSIIPIMDNMAVSTVFFKQDVSLVRETTHYPELKKRMANIAGEQVLFFPENRNIIQFFSPTLLDKSCILVKKKISNLFLI